MDGYYVAHRATCQACQATHLDVESHGQPSPAERVYVVDESPDGFTPDPRMMPEG